MLEPARAASVDITRAGVDGFGEFVEFGGEGESVLLLVDISQKSNVLIVRETLRSAQGDSPLKFEQFFVGLGWCAVDQALFALAGPIDIVRGGAPAGFAFDAIFEIDDELRLAEVVGEAFVDLGGANVPKERLGDLGAVLEILGSEHLDVRVMLGEIANEREFLLPRLLDLHGVGVKLHAVASKRAIFLEEAREEFLRRRTRDQKPDEFADPLYRHEHEHHRAEDGDGDVVEYA